MHHSWKMSSTAVYLYLLCILCQIKLQRCGCIAKFIFAAKFIFLLVVLQKIFMFGLHIKLDI